MTEYHQTCIKELVSVLLDNEWHEIYEFHERFSMPASAILDAINELLEKQLIVKTGRKIKLSDSLENKNIAMLNFYLKTTPPLALKKYSYWS